MALDFEWIGMRGMGFEPIFTGKKSFFGLDKGKILAWDSAPQDKGRLLEKHSVKPSYSFALNGALLYKGTFLFSKLPLAKIGAFLEDFT